MTATADTAALLAEGRGRVATIQASMPAKGPRVRELTNDQGLVARFTDALEASEAAHRGLRNRVAALVRLLTPDDMTPEAARQFEAILKDDTDA